MSDPTYPNCPRCGKPTKFRESAPGRMFRRECWCMACKICGVGDSDLAAWECVAHFEPKSDTPEADGELNQARNLLASAHGIISRLNAMPGNADLTLN